MPYAEVCVRLTSYAEVCITPKTRKTHRETGFLRPQKPTIFAILTQKNTPPKQPRNPETENCKPRDPLKSSPETGFWISQKKNRSDHTAKPGFEVCQFWEGSKTVPNWGLSSSYADFLRRLFTQTAENTKSYAD